MKVLVTGSDGFIGKNLRVALSRRTDITVERYDVQNLPEDLPRLVNGAEFIYHLAGANRPPDLLDFERVNVGLTRRLVELISDRPLPIVYSSSIQAELDNPYGRSKREAETVLQQYSARANAPVTVFRFPNVFGKWANPNYNSVVSTFCHNAARGLPLHVTDPYRRVTFVYIDEVIRVLLDCLDRPWSGFRLRGVDETFELTLAELRDLVLELAAARSSRMVPDLRRAFVRYLQATYTSYIPEEDRARAVELREDERGWLFELSKSVAAGQIFVSVTKPGFTRGQHYHDTKVEKFCVIRGRAEISMRPVLDPYRVVTYEVSDNPIRILDVPPGWTHLLRNVGEEDLITLFWASEIYDPARPDTYPAPVEGTHE